MQIFVRNRTTRAKRETQPLRIKLQVIVAAKRVDVIDGYAESLNIDKFDLAIDWGFFVLSLPNLYSLELIISLNYLGNYGLSYCSNNNLY